MRCCTKCEEEDLEELAVVYGIWPGERVFWPSVLISD